MNSESSDSHWLADDAVIERPKPETLQPQEPEFGLLDVVEAFTALRHEFRDQTTQGRELAATCGNAVEQIQKLENDLQRVLADSVTSDAKRLGILITEVDSQLTRAIDAISDAEITRDADHARLVRQEIDGTFAGLNVLQRWIARTFYRSVQACLARRPESTNRVTEGLRMVLAKLRSAMQENAIERIDVLGKPFDPETMNAIGTVDSQEYPAGHVAEQLLPTYLWRGDVLRIAETRIAR